MSTAEETVGSRERLTARHVRAGWLGLLVFLVLGIGLEVLHGFKASWYLAVGHSQRRLMWTLAHSHGTLIALVQLAWVASLRCRPAGEVRYSGLASWGLLAGQVLMPLGFLFGGVWLKGEDPGAGVFLVPVGAACLLVGVAAIALDLWSPPQTHAAGDEVVQDAGPASTGHAAEGRETESGSPTESAPGSGSVAGGERREGRRRLKGGKRGGN